MLPDSAVSKGGRSQDPPITVGALFQTDQRVTRFEHDVLVTGGSLRLSPSPSILSPRA